MGSVSSAAALSCREICFHGPRSEPRFASCRVPEPKNLDYTPVFADAIKYLERADAQLPKPHQFLIRAAFVGRRLEAERGIEQVMTEGRGCVGVVLRDVRNNLRELISARSAMAGSLISTRKSIAE